MRIASAVVCFALAGFVCLHPAPAAAAEGTVTAVPLHRLWRMSLHASYYTTRDAEKQAFLAKGWTDQGPQGYVSPWP